MSLKNEQIVFTGTLNSMSRKQAQSLVSSLKGYNQNNVSKQTTILVIGSSQSDLLREQQLSKKVIEANRLIKDGIPIQIVTEKHFIKLVSEQFHLLYENL